MALFATRGPALILVSPWPPGAVHIALHLILESERIIVIIIHTGSIVLFRLSFNQKCFATHN